MYLKVIISHYIPGVVRTFQVKTLYFIKYVLELEYLNL